MSFWRLPGYDIIALMRQLQLLAAEIIAHVQNGETLVRGDLVRLQKKFPRENGGERAFFTKAEMWQQVQQADEWQQLSSQQQKQIERFLQVKPIRTQSGVATVTILTKPWPCPGKCIFCPADVRMPKSYLANEPGAQRAELNFFDPYLQVHNRLETLKQMGHKLDKVEVIVLGGTWDAYPLDYQRWFIKEVYQALNDFANEKQKQMAVIRRRGFYDSLVKKLSNQEAVLTDKPEENKQRWRDYQQQVDLGKKSYNQLLGDVYLHSAWEQAVAAREVASWEELEQAQQINSQSECRNVGLVVETRPDEITWQRAMKYRRLGCTKIQLGIQSVKQMILDANKREISVEKMAQALAILRLFGFKLHVHFMANLYQATPESDIEDFATLVTDERFLPDEIKLYPCALLASSELINYYRDGRWRPYSEQELLRVLTANMLVAPEYVRISRMIRDFSAHDIVDGNKKTNFRQLVDQELFGEGRKSCEIRSREIRGRAVKLEELELQVLPYSTSVSQEYFLQYVTSDGAIAGFLRLSLPDTKRAEKLLGKQKDEWQLLSEQAAMIREVHVYGRVSALGQTGSSQHLGLGRRLVNRAEKIAREHSRTIIRVISAIGTREYYGKLGYELVGYYQEKGL